MLCLPHDPHLRDGQVRRAYRARLRRLRRLRRVRRVRRVRVWRIRDEYERAVEARRVAVAYRAARTGPQRRRVLADMAVQPEAWRGFYLHPDVRVMAEALLPPLRGGPHGLMEACDLRALAREGAALRLERPASWRGRVPARAGCGRGRAVGSRAELVIRRRVNPLAGAARWW